MVSETPPGENTRIAAFPEVPTLGECGYPGTEGMQQWFGAFVPAGTPKAVIDRLSIEMRKAIEAPEARSAFTKLALLPTPLSADAFADFLRGETRTFAAVILEAHIQVD